MHSCFLIECFKIAMLVNALRFSLIRGAVTNTLDVNCGFVCNFGFLLFPLSK
mgnify:CR=1 FL=1